MSGKTRYYKIGVFVLIGFIVAIIAIVVFGAGQFFRKKMLIETYFDQSVQGLDVGAPLKFQGVRVGVVNEIGYVFNEYSTNLTYVLVRCEIFQDLVGVKKSLGRIPTTEERASRIKELIDTKGLRLQLDSSGITGVAFLNMVYLDPERYPRLKIDFEPDSLYIPSAPGTITQISKAIEKLTDSIETLDLKEITDKVDLILVNINKGIEDAQIPAISQDIRELLETAQSNSEKVNSILESQEVKGTLKNLSQTLENLNLLSRKVNSITSSERGEIVRILEDMKATSENLRELTDTAKRYPSWFLFGNPPPPLNEVKK
jgi:phospholipid/cholesterol/gamma-HCH transport system substrate-binding protein/paraquat-inducible protein B